MSDIEKQLAEAQEENQRLKNEVEKLERRIRSIRPWTCARKECKDRICAIGL